MQINIGDTFYAVRTVFSEDTKMINGEIWKRVSPPTKTFEIHEYQVLGILSKYLEGEWPEAEDYQLERQFYINNITKNNKFVTDEDWFSGDVFYTKEKAQKYIEMLGG